MVISGRLRDEQVLLVCINVVQDRFLSENLFALNINIEGMNFYDGPEIIQQGSKFL